jgi:DNA-binding NarL/FixJ family response regulator
VKKPRVLLADDHAMVVAGLSRLLEPDYELAGTAENGQVLIEMAARLAPDVIVADISMPLLNGIDAAREIRKRGIGAKIIFLTMHSDAGFAVEALEAGASGYLLKQSAAEELLAALREVLKGRTYVTPLIARDVFDTALRGQRAADRPSAKLTARERQVLQLLAEGKSAKEIAAVLNVSTRTAEFHKYNVMDKLGLRSTAELTQYAMKHGLVS